LELLSYQNLTDRFSLATKYIPDKVKPLFLTYSIFETVQLYQKNVGVESLHMVQAEEQDDEDNLEMQTGDDDLQQQNYNCYVNLQQYA
jgi:hypothetical protein